MQLDKQAAAPQHGINFSAERFLGASVDLCAGVVVLVGTSVAVLLVLIVMSVLVGAIVGVGAAIVVRPAGQIVVFSLIGLTTLYAIWITAIWGAISALEVFGLELRGRWIYAAFPLAPAIAIVVGPFALLASLGRTAQPRIVLAVIGLVLLLAAGAGSCSFLLAA